MQEVVFNLFPVKVKPQNLFLYEIRETKPESRNRTVRFRLAANIAKRVSKTQSPVFSVGELIYSVQKIASEHREELDIEGTNVPFEITIEQIDKVDLTDVTHGIERLVNRLVDWYYREKIPNSFHMENANYLGENIFARLESRLHKNFKINVNEGIMRATRTFAGVPYLLLDVDYRVTWEQSLWDSVKFFVKNVLNRDVYLPDHQTIQAINERFGRVGKKRGVRVQGKNQVGEYEVLEFDFTENPDTPGTAGEKSQRQYFSSVYGNALKIKDGKQPLVKVRVSRGYYYGKEMDHVPELLEFGRIPPHLRQNQRLMSALANIEKPAPRGRYSQIISFIQGDPFGRTKGFAEDEFVKNFVEVSPEPVKVLAKVLPPIKIKMGDSVFSVSSDSAFLSNIWKRKFHRTPKVKKVIILYGKEREEDVLNFYSMLQQTAAEQGMILPDPSSVVVDGGLPEDYVRALGKKVDADIVMTFVPREDEFYNTIKKRMLVKHEVLHQNISYENTLDTLAEYERRGNELGIKTILTLVTMQLCAKLGGAPWAFSEPIYDENSPILGLDVFHQTEGGDSITGGCAVFDPYGEYLFSDAKVTSLRDLLTSVLSRYIKNFGEPSGLLIFRDGLNFTQEQKFLLAPNGELEIVDEVLSDLGFSNYIFVMEKKGTHLRMYKKLSAVKVDNPAPGTVVIGKPFETNEMLMVSQETYQGTVTPVLYKVIRPKDPDMERIAIAVNKLCRHHWNTHRAIKIPAPALHADRITYLIRKILGRAPTKPDLLNKPFYL